MRLVGAPAERGKKTPKQNRWVCSQNQPAAVILRIALQRGGSSGQAQPGEGVVVREARVRKAGDAVWLVVNVLPVGAEAFGSLGERSEQVAVQLVDDLLIHAGFELPGEEGGPHRLLPKDRGARQGGTRLKRREKIREQRFAAAPEE